MLETSVDRQIEMTRGRACCLMLAGWIISGFAYARECAWDAHAFSFTGTPQQQARCLLRDVSQGGVVADRQKTLPASLGQLIGKPVMMTADRLRALLHDRNIDETTIGGALDQPLSITEGEHPKSATYFVIHDTSTIFCERGDFPANADMPDAQWNHVETWMNHDQAHLFITRDGASYAPQQRTFATPWRAVKFEKQLGIPSRGLFLHIENVQLRRPALAADAALRDDSGECVNDRIAQSPGFTTPQLQRLALVYVAASVRAGHWLIPAYHAVLDTAIPGGHDDPQNFDLDAWAKHICDLRRDLGDACASAHLR